MSKQPTVSLVIPVYNEQAALPLLFKELATLKKTLPKDTELIIVNDGSNDSTRDLLDKTKLPFPGKIIHFSRNFGHQSALLAGLKEAKGNYVVSMDADLQHPLELIPDMLALHQQGYDVVLTKRIDGKIVSNTKKLTSLGFYRLINALSNTKVHENSSDFRSLNRRALNALLTMPEQRKFLRGMVEWIGFKSIIIPFQVRKRVKGQSKYTLSKMLKLALEGLVSFSTRPLYLAGIFGSLLFLAAMFYALYVLYVRFFGSGVVDGWASVLFVSLVIGGFLALFIGILGLYVAAIYDEIKNRPNYIIESKTTK